MDLSIKGIVTDEEIEDFARRLRSLSLSEIDEVFHLCGWEEICDKGNYKSLPEHRLKYIKESQKNAEEWIGNLLYDEPYPSAVKEVKKLLQNALSKFDK